MSPVKRRKILRRIIREKKNRPCADCGKQYDPRLMTFDHLPHLGKKKFNLGGSLSGLSEKDVMDEIAKCQVLCRLCHDAVERLRLDVKQGKITSALPAVLVPQGTPGRLIH